MIAFIVDFGHRGKGGWLFPRNVLADQKTEGKSIRLNQW
jgi:hypothetical protein